MINVNFLTPEYKLKLLLKQILRMGSFFVLVILLFEIGVSQYLQKKIDNKEKNIRDYKAKTLSNNTERINIEKKRKEIPDLTDKIQILEEMFSKKNLRFSEVIYNLKENTPKKVWYTDLNYKNSNLVIKGYASDDKSTDTNSELNVYKLERNLKESGKYSGVKGEYLKQIDLKGNTVNIFQYELNVLDTPSSFNGQVKEGGTK